MDYAIAGKARLAEDEEKRLRLFHETRGTVEKAGTKLNETLKIFETEVKEFLKFC
jgi:hypothetical protein